MNRAGGLFEKVSCDMDREQCSLQSSFSSGKTTRRMGERCFRKTGGFTLVETVVATLVLGIALVAVARMLRMGSLASQCARCRIVALNLVSQKLSLLKDRAFDDLVSSGPDPVVNLRSGKMETQVVSVDQNLKKVTVIATWLDQSGEVRSESAECLIAKTTLEVSQYKP